MIRRAALRTLTPAGAGDHRRVLMRAARRNLWRFVAALYALIAVTWTAAAALLIFN